jgi:hypothetical protein
MSETLVVAATNLIGPHDSRPRGNLRLRGVCYDDETMFRKRSKAKLATRESWAFDAVTESLGELLDAPPHTQVPAGMLALVTYASAEAGPEERVEVVRAGQVVKETLPGGPWRFARGTMVKAGV